MQHLHFLHVGGMGSTEASHHHDSNSCRAQKLAHEFPPICKSAAGPSLPPDASRHCSSQHTAALLRAVDNLKRYKPPVVKPFLDSREKYGYFRKLLNIIHI
ncbi:hypothetical protein LZK77_21305 [Rhizobium leguminosarum]|jgi:hypothetical protein|nr:hypothetical protein LZK77_21305 [Rhizobium leguminosarum]